ncbi:MAG: diaminopimelate epimerase [candidate division KSB1 bacterium]|nr:diaminopimelate epimerase [candidate division KSB1 bacterium]MDZ7378431.1 diaminopimelate epimerase [candidate division KSB1 bacterium]MDZ7386322.1 diaminopimelate epimerase [candidate division KSB1 bacterium]MDZ7392734.1 diaminopimelate epimerase [candidate division KSB1 bacterium]
MRFVKISATGNDFVVFDNRNGHVDVVRHLQWCSWLCQRRVGVGADGVILVQRSATADFCYVHINSDGSIAEMCGNGSRAVAFFAHVEGIAQSPVRFEIGGKVYTARVDGSRVTTYFVPPAPPRFALCLPEEHFLDEGGFIDTGVPHYVLFAQDVQGLDVVGLGRKYRHHPAFAPRGANVDFVQVLDRNTLRMRTYERGVEDETLACGTGAVAASIVAHLRRGCVSPLAVEVPGGVLQVSFDRTLQEVTLTGDVEVVFEGFVRAPA